MGLLCIVDAKDQKDLVHYSSQQPSSYKKKVLQLADGKHLLTGGASQGKKTVLRFWDIAQPSTVQRKTLQLTEGLDLLTGTPWQIPRSGIDSPWIKVESGGDASACSMEDWRPLLSESEQENLEKYEEMPLADIYGLSSIFFTNTFTKLLFARAGRVCIFTLKDNLWSRAGQE